MAKINVAALMKIIIFVLFSVLFYFIGNKFGEIRSTADNKRLCSERNKAITNNLQQLDYVAADALISPGTTASQIECTLWKEEQSVVAIPTSSHALGAATCPLVPNMTSMLHLAKATVPQIVFPFLHHPASPAKWNFFFTQTREWEGNTVDKSPCKEIYLTRTGSRGSQPNNAPL